MVGSGSGLDGVQAASVRKRRAVGARTGANPAIAAARRQALRPYDERVTLTINLSELAARSSAHLRVRRWRSGAWHSTDT